MSQMHEEVHREDREEAKGSLDIKEGRDVRVQLDVWVSAGDDGTMGFN